jgi:uncharacterized protein (TIGR02145 family)
MSLVLLFFYSCKKEESNPSKTVTDIDGNVYHTVTIGTQVWLVENLKTTKYNDGSSIPFIKDAPSWFSLSASGYCWYNNVVSGNKGNNGALYNWHAVNSGKLCPTGWHVPTNEEWTVLTDFLGGETLAGGKLKEAHYSHWKNPNSGANNETGFTGLPAGYCDSQQDFSGLGEFCAWWSSSEDSTNSGLAWYRGLYYYVSDVGKLSTFKNSGYSVRCLED